MRRFGEWLRRVSKFGLSLHDLQQQDKADQNGKWIVYMSVLKAGDPFNFKVSGSQDSLRYTNVLVGEVWLASGQSNMNRTIAKVANKKAAVAHAGEKNTKQI